MKKEIENLKQENLSLKMNNIDTTKYKSWSTDEVLFWILSLEKDRFKRYENILSVSLKDEEINGSNLNIVEESDIKGWGVKKIEDKKSLFKHIRSLVEQQQQNNIAPKNNEGAPTAYIG